MATLYNNDQLVFVVVSYVLLTNLGPTGHKYLYIYY